MAPHDDAHEKFSLGLVAHCTGIEIEDKFEKRIVGVRWSTRSMVVYIDDQANRKFKLRSSGSLTHWQGDYRVWFRLSSVIKIELFCKNILPAILPTKRSERQLLARFSGKLIDLFSNDAAFDMTDDTGTRLDGIKIKIKLAIVSNSPRDIAGRVDAAISRLDDSVFSQMTKHVDVSASAIEGGYNSAQIISSCIPSLGQAFQAMVKIARNFGDVHPILKVSCTILLSIYEAFKNEQFLNESVRALAESLREMVYAANECPDLLVIEGAENVIEAIGHVSLQITSLIDEYTRLSFAARGLRDTLSDDMKERIGSFQARCRELMERFSSRVNIDTNQTVHQIQNARRIETTLDWLMAPDPSRNYNNAQERRQEGTCLWFLTGKEFSNWKESAGSLLWVYGIPGCGKTVLSSSAIENVTIHCAANHSCAIAYFFFDSRDAQDGLQRHDGLIRSLIKQLSLQCDGMPTEIEKLLGAGNVQPSLKSLHIALEVLLAKFDHAYMVVDSLDESKERWNVLNWLQEITRWEVFKHNAHLLVTSRDEIDIRESITSLGAVKVCMEGKSIEDDIRMYLDWTLRTSFHMKRWGEARKQEIQQKVLAMSQGMFRLAALQIEEIRNCHSVHELRTQLDNLPRNLHDIYNRILSKLEEAPRRSALKFLQWLAFSARLLQLKELAEVVGVDLDAKPYPTFCTDSRYGDPQSVLIICTNLVIISVEGNVQLAHFSVKEFLLSSYCSQHFGFNINPKLSHSLIAQTCLAYLLQFDDLEILNDCTLENFPLAQYAADNWVAHAHAGTSDSRIDPLNALIYAFFTGNKAPFTSWVRLRDLDAPRYPPDMKRMPIGSCLYYTALAGLEDISQALMENGEDPNAKGYSNVTVLQVASRKGQYRTVQRLLAKGAEVNTPGGWSGCALRAASQYGHEEIVRLLLEHGAEVNTRGKDNTPLQEASIEGHEGIVRLLLEKGADMEALSIYSPSALQAASLEGHTNIVQIMLDKGADVNIRGGLYGHPLHEASKGGNRETVRLLLERGAEVNLKSGQFGTALQAASIVGYEDIVRLLLENGADVRMQGGEYGTALQAAASGGEELIAEVLMNLHARGDVLSSRDNNALQAALRKGHTNAVQLLVEKGAEVNIHAGRFGSALRAASFRGHKENVQLLLEKGAEVNMQTKHGTALQAASLEGHEDIVRILLENGAEVNMNGGRDGPAIIAAASRGHESIVRLLLESGAGVNVNGGQNDSALQAAASKGQESIVRLLLKEGAEVNTQGGDYGSALGGAVWSGSEEVVRLLLENGADPNAPGSIGRVLRWSSKYHHEAVGKLLLEYGAVWPDSQGDSS